MSLACTTELTEEEPATKIGATSKAESYFTVSVTQRFCGGGWAASDPTLITSGAVFEEISVQN